MVTPQGGGAAHWTREILAELSVPRDVVLQLFDDEFLLGDDLLDDITNGDHANHIIGLDHREMADALIGIRAIHAPTVWVAWI